MVVSLWIYWNRRGCFYPDTQGEILLQVICSPLSLSPPSLRLHPAIVFTLLPLGNGVTLISIRSASIPFFFHFILYIFLEKYRIIIFALYNLKNLKKYFQIHVVWPKEILKEFFIWTKTVMLYFISPMLYDVIRHISSHHGSSIHLILWHGCVHIHISQHRSHLLKAPLTGTHKSMLWSRFSSAFEKYLLHFFITAIYMNVIHI